MKLSLKRICQKIAKKARKAQERYAVLGPYAAAHLVHTGHEMSLKERIDGIPYSGVPSILQEHIKYENECMLKKDDFPKILNEQFDLSKKIFDIDLKFYKYEKYYLDFEGNRKLDIWESLNVAFGRKKFIRFVTG